MLANSDTLLFHHDGTNEFVRATGSRELRFHGGRRLYFFTPRRFIDSAAFAFADFREVNHLPHTPRCLIKFRLASGYSSPELFYAGLHHYSDKYKAQAPTIHGKTYTFTLNVGEPDWYMAEFSARLTIKGKPITQMLARILICSGDPVPLPFDTLREANAPAVLPHTDSRMFALLNADRARTGDSLLLRDSLPAQAAQMLLYAFTDWNARKITNAVITARALKQFIPSAFKDYTGADTGSAELLGAILLSGENPEEIGWEILTSPMMYASGLLHNANSVVITPLRDDRALHVAMVFYKKRS